MAVTLFCPNLKCRSILQVPDQARGKKVRCGQCRTTFIVPPKEESSSPSGTVAAPGSEKSK